jgi:toxin CcdB
MARYDVYRDPKGSDSLLLCLQDDLFDSLETRVVVPLLPARPQRAALKRLNPLIIVGSQRYVLHTQLIVSVPKRALKDRVENLSSHRDEIIAALDFLFQGF